MKFPFIRKRKYWYLLSGLLIAASIAATSVWGLKPGIDFTGGSLLEVQFSNDLPAVADINGVLNTGEYGSVSVQPAENNVMLIRMKDLSADEHSAVITKLEGFYQGQAEGNQVIEQRYESIGPVIGQELKDKAIITVIVSLLFIIMFIAYAFRKVSMPVASWKYGIAALVAMFHDIIIPIGVFAVLGKFFGYEINILFITAILTTLGYSINDTIVVFDRIRENLYRRHEDFADAVEDSMNQTFARSVNTSFTTLLVLFAIYFFGGESIKQFVLALLIGIGSGTYSSIFIASPLLVDWHRWQSRKS